MKVRGSEELEMWLYGQEFLLLLQNTRVQFQAPTMGARNHLYSSSSRESDVLLQHPWGLHPRGAQIYMQTNT